MERDQKTQTLMRDFNGMAQKTVFERQNEEYFLRLWAAQCQLYDEYKRNRSIWLVAAIAVAVAGTGAVAALDWAIPFIVIAAIALLVMEYTWLQAINTARKEAARIQEQIDCELLEIPWNETDPRRPDRDTILEATERYIAKSGAAGLDRFRGWYETVNQNTPIRDARILCQRENLKWDLDLRTWWVWVARVALVLIAVGIAVIGTALNMSLPAVLGTLVLLMLPIINQAFQYVESHRLNAETKRNLKGYADALLPRAQDPAVSELELVHASRLLQDKILSSRIEGLAVPTWFYDLYKWFQK